MRLGHLNAPAIRRLGAEIVVNNPNFHCRACHLGDAKRTVSRAGQIAANAPFERLHIDLIGPINPPAEGGARYLEVFTCDRTRSVWAYPLVTKGQAAIELRKMVAMAE